MFGGIDRTGQHNKHLYKFEIDNLFGQVKVQKVGTSSLKIPGGRAESSLNILNYKERTRINLPNKELVIIFGGVNDIKILNELWVYRAITHTWTSVENKAEPVLPRKGHSAILFNNNTDGNMNSDIIRVYNLVVFGGKNDFGYLNDIIVIDITYMVLEDNFFFKFRAIDTEDIIEPEKREVIIYNLSGT